MAPEEELRAEIERLRAENENLKKPQPRGATSLITEGKRELPQNDPKVCIHRIRTWHAADRVYARRRLGREPWQQVWR